MDDLLVEAFNLFDRRIQPSVAQRHAAESRGHHVSQLLSQNDQILECRLVGSLVRSTAIQRFSDVDILIIFDPQEVSGQNSKEILDLTELMVNPFSNVATRTPTTISLQYPDWPNVDILPGWAAEDGKHEAFRIPAGTSQSWQLYFPSYHNGIVRDGSARLGSRFKIIIRAIKWWNQLNGGLLRSYEIEELISDLFRVEIPEYTEAIYSIFNAIAHKLADLEYSDRSISTNSVPANVRIAWLLSHQAREMAIEGYSKRDLESLFRRLFGEQFPVVCS